MNKKSLFCAISLLTIANSNAAITVSLLFDAVLASNGTKAATGTLWALVSDGGNNGFGGFGTDQGLGSRPAGTANAFFTANQSLSIGSQIGSGNTVFAMGGFSSPGQVLNVISNMNNYGTNGVAENTNFALYWFPGATYTGPNGLTGATTSSHSQNISNQVGGVSNITRDIGAIFDRGMILPGDTGGAFTMGAGSISEGGSTPNTDLRAVTLIPEPSTFLISAISVLGLIRRKRH